MATDNGSTNLTINFVHDIAVPDTGYIDNSAGALQIGLWSAGIVALVLGIVLGAVFLHKRQMMRFPIKLKDDNSAMSLRNNTRKIAKVIPIIGIVALSVVCINFINPKINSEQDASAVINDSYEKLSIATLGDIYAETNLAEDGSAVAELSDTVLVKTATKHGYSLFVSSADENNKLYLDGNNESEYFLAPTSQGAELADNSWGYKNETDEWDAVPALGNEALVKEVNEATLADDPTEIRYGAKAGNDLMPGEYQGTVVYTAIANYVPYDLTMNAGDNTTIKVERLESPIGEGKLGDLSNGDEIFENDVLKISGSANTGYNPTTLTVNGVTFNSGDTLVVDGSVSVVTANVELQTFAVTYNCNGGSGSINAQTKIYGIDLTLNDGTTGCSKTGWRVEKWNTKADGTGTSYVLSGTYSNNEALDLYAIWTPQEYSLAVNAGTGAGVTVKRTSSEHGGSIGEISTSDKLYYGDELEIMFSAETGYELTSYFVNNVAVTPAAGKVTYTATGNTTVAVTAQPIAKTLTFSTDDFSVITVERISSPLGGATGTLANGAKIYYHDQIKFTFRVNPGYTLNMPTVDGSEVSLEDGSYTLTINEVKDVAASVSAYIEYQIVYKDISEEAKNMPEAQTSGKITDTSYTVQIQDEVIPYREGYSFRGWTSTKPSADSLDTVAMTDYDPAKEITFSLNTTSGVVTVSPTSENLNGSTLTLYAAWKETTNFADSVTTMQAMTSSVCEAASTPTKWDISDSTDDGRPSTETIYGVPAATLTDTRDGNTYTVAKLADGKCWMTQNLALERTSTFTTLTPSDSNVTSNFELPVSQTSGSESWGTEEDQATLNTKHIYSSGNSLYGNYYNFYTATAGTGGTDKTTGAASGSICPKGWRLPTSTRTGDFRKMMETGYGIVVNKAGQEEYVNKLLSTPFFYVAAGQYTNGILMVGETARYWSATLMSAVDAYYATIDMQSNLINPANYWHKFYGEPVRCITE